MLAVAHWEGGYIHWYSLYAYGQQRIKTYSFDPGQADVMEAQYYIACLNSPKLNTAPPVLVILSKQPRGQLLSACLDTNSYAVLFSPYVLSLRVFFPLGLSSFRHMSELSRWHVHVQPSTHTKCPSPRAFPVHDWFSDDRTRSETS